MRRINTMPDHDDATRRNQSDAAQTPTNRNQNDAAQTPTYRHPNDATPTHRQQQSTPPEDMPRMLLVAGTTETAAIEGISAAGADPELRVQTPSADAELLVHGRTVQTESVPVSPTGCPTPALVTRAGREVLGFPVSTVDAGLAAPTAAPTVAVDASPGKDIREAVAVPDAAGLFDRARSLGAKLPDERVLIGETIPGGTTTALGVLRALGEPATVSSSLPTNPIERKREVVETGLATSGLDPGACAGAPTEAISAVGDPVLATVAGLTVGLAESGSEVILAGGTQQLAAAALARHAGLSASLTVATTSYVPADETAAVTDLAAAVDVDLTVTDPGFAGETHPTARQFEAGEAKEGVGMGGALHLAARAAVRPAMRERLQRLYDRLVDPAKTAEATGQGP
jgi:uncharacterized protein (TIGR00303 family)